MTDIMRRQNTAPTQLLSLPNELIHRIGHELSQQRDIAALVRTCRLFYDMFGDHLYRHNETQDGASCLMWAASLNKYHTMRRAVRAGIQLQKYENLIYVIAYNGSAEAAEVILSTPGINPMMEDANGWSPLTIAASFGHANVIKKLVEHGADMTAHTSIGWSPVMAACTYGSLGAVKLLIGVYGASMECRNPTGWSALRSACTYGHPEIVKYLLARGADVTVRNTMDRTCLHEAADEGHTEIVAALLDHGANIADTLLMGWGPLTLAVESRHHETAALLLQRGADTEQRCTNNQWTALCVAADMGDAEMIKILLNHGACISAKAVGGWSALALAATNGHLEAVETLLEHGANPDIRTNTGWTPLMTAADGNFPQLIDVLVKYGADTEAKTEYGWTALFFAADGRHIRAASRLLAHGADCMAPSQGGWTPGIRATFAGALPILNRFLAKPGFDIDHVDNAGRCAFFHAAMRGHTRIVEQLLPLTSRANTPDRHGTTPILAAARNGHHPVVEILLKEGYADLVERDYLGCTMLAHAQRSGKRRLVKMIKKYAEQAGIPIWLDDPAGQLRQHRYDYTTCICSVCGRSSVHAEQAYMCESGDCGMILCAECIEAGKTCDNSAHMWKAHECVWNENFPPAPTFLAASAKMRPVQGGVQGAVEEAVESVGEAEESVEEAVDSVEEAVE